MSLDAERETADRILEFADAQLGRLDKHAHFAALEAVLMEMITWREAILAGGKPKKRGRGK